MSNETETSNASRGKEERVGEMGKMPRHGCADPGQRPITSLAYISLKRPWGALKLQYPLNQKKIKIKIK